MTATTKRSIRLRRSQPVYIFLLFALPICQGGPPRKWDEERGYRASPYCVFSDFKEIERFNGAYSTADCAKLCFKATNCTCFEGGDVGGCVLRAGNVTADPAPHGYTTCAYITARFKWHQMRGRRRRDYGANSAGKVMYSRLCAYNDDLNELNRLSVPSVEDCVRECGRNLGCSHFSFKITAEADEGICWLMSGFVPLAQSLPEGGSEDTFCGYYVLE